MQVFYSDWHTRLTITCKDRIQGSSQRLIAWCCARLNSSCAGLGISPVWYWDSSLSLQLAMGLCTSHTQPRHQYHSICFPFTMCTCDLTLLLPVAISSVRTVAIGCHKSHFMINMFINIMKMKNPLYINLFCLALFNHITPGDRRWNTCYLPWTAA